MLPEACDRFRLAASRIEQDEVKKRALAGEIFKDRYVRTIEEKQFDDICASFLDLKGLKTFDLGSFRTSVIFCWGETKKKRVPRLKALPVHN